MSKLPRRSSLNEIEALAALISRRSDCVSDEIHAAVMTSGIWLGESKDLGMDGYAKTIDEGDEGRLNLESRGRNCWTVKIGDSTLVLMVSMMSLGAR